MSPLSDGRALPLVQIEFQDYRPRHEDNHGNISKLPLKIAFQVTQLSSHKVPVETNVPW